MKYRKLGDLKVSIVGIGAWQAGFKSWGSGYTKEDVISAYRYAFDSGINFIDTAEIYGDGVSEKVVGEAIKDYTDIVVATKVAGYNLSRNALFKSAEKSRRRLGLDVIDLYQIHWPPSIYMNLCKALRNMERLIDKGVIRHIGVSNFDEKLLEKALECMSKYEIVSNQVQYSLAYRSPDKGLKDFMDRRGIVLIAYSPLAKGVLAGKTKADNPARRMDGVFRKASKDENLQKILNSLSEKYGVSKAVISLRWLIERGVLPIPGVKNKRHVNSILDAVEISLSQEDMELLDKASSKYKDMPFNTVAPRIIPGLFVKFVVKLMGGV